MADRFHLLENLEEVLEKVFKGHEQALKRVESAQLQAEGVAAPPPVEPQCEFQAQQGSWPFLDHQL